MTTLRMLSCLACTLWALAGCEEKKPAPSAPSPASASAAMTASAKPGAAPVGTRELLPLPSGPVLAILRGQGVGPIRFGANEKTIERLMAAPCAVKSERRCSYPARAVEFVFDEDGGTKEIHLYALRVPMGDVTAGMFNGRFPSGLNLGMLKSAVFELEGPPSRVERVEGAGKVAERLHYDGMQVDLQRQSDGELAVSHIVLLDPDTATPPAASGP